MQSLPDSELFTLTGVVLAFCDIRDLLMSHQVDPGDSNISVPRRFLLQCSDNKNIRECIQARSSGAHQVNHHIGSIRKGRRMYS